MNRFFILLTSSALLAMSMLFSPSNLHAQETAPAVSNNAESELRYFRGTITDVRDTLSPTNGAEQTFSVKYCCDANGNEQNGEIKQVKNGDDGEDRDFKKNDDVIILQVRNESQNSLYLTDHYRLPGLLILVLLFITVAIVIGGKKSIAAFAGLGFSFGLLIYVVVPQIARGANVLVVGGIGAVVIGLIAIFMAHGVTKKTILAVQGTVITIILAFAFSSFAIWLVQLFGKGSEDTFYVQSAYSGTINMKGLLLVGMIIGVLGVLDDVTTALTATIEEIHDANPNLKFKDLFTRGMRVGREHIASLINTLVFAYAGTSLPLLLLFQIQSSPWWVALNTQFLAEEITRTIVGSIALILAVPITTYLASRSYAKTTQ
jgi:uncharacterized membrane protein